MRNIYSILLRTAHTIKYSAKLASIQFLDRYNIRVLVSTKMMKSKTVAAMIM
jgi:hypothetical protein